MTFVAYQVSFSEAIPGLWGQMTHPSVPIRAEYLLMVILLVPVNWGIEAFKWKFLLQDIEKMSFTYAFKAVFAGVALAILTPARLGEYGGRIWYLTKGNRSRGAIVTGIGALGQITATLLLGLAGSIYFLSIQERFELFDPELGLAIVIGLSAVVLILYYHIDQLTRFLPRLPYLNSKKWVLNSIEGLSSFSHRRLNILLALSILRLLVYSSQFALILLLFKVEVSFLDAALLSSAVFLGQMLLPLPALAELGSRAALALLIFGTFSASPLSIISASLLLWLLNLSIPAMIGAVLMLFKK